MQIDRERLILGTAQLGMTYGIANKTGQPSYEIAQGIVLEAVRNGILLFDTAQAYGESEQILAQSLSELGYLNKVQVFTKIAPSIDHLDSAAVNFAVEESFKYFGPAFYCCMLHHEGLLKQWDEGLGETLVGCRENGMFQHAGISVYSPSAAMKALETEGIDFVQLPANVLDRRHEEAGVMDLAQELGKTIIIRSVYLQGAFLIPMEELPENTRHLRPHLETLVQIAVEHNILMRDAAMQFVCKRWPNCMVTFGAELPQQVRETVGSWGESISLNAYAALEKQKGQIPLRVVRPDLW